MNSYAEITCFMQKDSGIKKPDCTSQIPFSVMPCPICALKVALSMLKLPLRATFLPVHLALSGLFYIFAAKTSSIIQRELTMEDLFY